MVVRSYGYAICFAIQTLQRSTMMVIFAFLSGCAFMQGHPASVTEFPFAHASANRLSVDPSRRIVFISAFDPDRFPSDTPLSGNTRVEFACDEDNESEDDSRGEEHQPHRLADHLWGDIAHSITRAHEIEPSRRVASSKPLSNLRC